MIFLKHLTDMGFSVLLKTLFLLIKHLRKILNGLFELLYLSEALSVRKMKKLICNLTLSKKSEKCLI